MVMLNLFRRCFKNDGKPLLTISKQCCTITMSDYIGSDIGIIFHILKAFNFSTTEERGKIFREMVAGRHMDMINPLLFDMQIGSNHFLKILHDHKSYSINIVILRLCNINLKCNTSHNLILICLILGVLSSTPGSFKEHKYDDFFYEKIYKIIRSIQKDKKRNYIVIQLKDMVRELTLLSYNESGCDRDLIDTVLTVSTVLLLIHILSKDNKLDKAISRIIYDNNISLKRELMDVFSAL